MADLIYLENNILKAKKSCDLCTHISTCKFYSQVEKLFKANEFYEMTKYLEWNNNLTAWSENSSCQFYTPFLFNHDLFQQETRKDKSYINAFSWYKIVQEYFKQNLLAKYSDYFQQEIVKVKLNSWAKDLPDEDLYSHCYTLRCNHHIYTFKAKDGEWLEVISLIDVLTYFQAFQKI